MISQSKDIFLELVRTISNEKKMINEMIRLNEKMKKENEENKPVIKSQIDSLKKSLKNENEKMLGIVEKLNVVQPLKAQKDSRKDKPPLIKKESSLKKFLTFSKRGAFSSLEKETVKRIGKEGKKVVVNEERRISKYIEISNRIFDDYSEVLAKKKYFRYLKRDLVKSNLQLVPKTYISIILFTLLLSLISSFILMGFFLFFNIGSSLPIITFSTEPILGRFLKVFWIPFVIPITTLIVLYSYPNMEKKFSENKINEEIPFATIHMSAISGSMIDPTKIFSIIISTGEYPYISKEFTKLLNQINIFGQDIVGALRSLSFTTANPKLSELLNGLSTTINSGGDLSQFFEKRAESLLFEYKIEREKRTKSAETFMDVYISIVIAAPMIFMLLLMMMKISGLGISLSSTMISLIMVVGVSIINIGFLVFLQLKQPAS